MSLKYLIEVETRRGQYYNFQPLPTDFSVANIMRVLLRNGLERILDGDIHALLTRTPVPNQDAFGGFVTAVVSWMAQQISRAVSEVKKLDVRVGVDRGGSLMFRNRPEV